MKHIPYKRLLCLFATVTLCICLLALAACNKENDENEIDTSTDTTIIQNEGLALVKDGAAARIIYSSDYADELLKEANTLANKIKQLTGTAPKVFSVAAAGEENSDSIDILLGNVSYKQSKSVYATLSDYGECKVQTVGNKLVIASWDVNGIIKGVSELSATLVKSVDENKDLFIATDYSVSVYDAGTAGKAKLPISSEIEPKIIDQGDGCVEYVFARADSVDLTSYAALLEANGYTLYTENTIAGKSDDAPNLFKTYKNDKFVVNLSIMPGISKMFVIVDDLSKTALPALETENSYDKTVTYDSLFTQVGLYSYTPDDPDLSSYGSGKPPSFEAHGSDDTNGQSEIIRLADGSFIIIDGGHGNDGDAANLYKVLEKQAPDKENIVIAAWIFTHAHNDHVLTFPDFAKSYGTDVKIEQIILNFPSEETAKAGGGDCRSNVYSVLSSTALKNTKLVKAHVGQKFYIRNATVEMLCNFEMLQPYTLKKDDNSYNNTSLVFSVELEDVKFMILGDCYNKQSEIIPKCYGTAALKSDVVQVAHHGIGGTDASVYSLIDADWAIWPAGNYYYNFPAWGSSFDYIELTKHSYNSWFNDPANIDPNNIYWALDDLDIFTVKNGGVSVETKSFDEYLGIS